ncbi:MAG: hypothetical protein ACHQII_02980 [Bacteroidia bacterium]
MKKGIIIGIVFCWLAVLVFFFFKSNVAKGVTAEKIKLVKPGMTIDQVIKILGKPLRLEALRGTHNGNCQKPINRPDIEINNGTDIKQEVENIFHPKQICCDGYKDDLDSANQIFTFVYSYKKHFSSNYPMLWVHFDCRNQVNSIYVNMYYGFIPTGHVCIYSKSWALDRNSLGPDKTKTDYIIDENNFNKLFRH